MMTQDWSVRNPKECLNSPNKQMESSNKQIPEKKKKSKFINLNSWLVYWMVTSYCSCASITKKVFSWSQTHWEESTSGELEETSQPDPSCIESFPPMWATATGPVLLGSSSILVGLTWSALVHSQKFCIDYINICGLYEYEITVEYKNECSHSRYKKLLSGSVLSCLWSLYRYL